MKKTVDYKFDDGTPFHGSKNVRDGKLTGATDTDYFQFYCPECPGKQVLEKLNYKVMEDRPLDDPEMRSWANPGHERRWFALAIELRCPGCGLRDCVKIGNI